LDQLKKKRILENEIKNIVKSNTTVVENEEESLLLRAIERTRKKAEALKKQNFNLLDMIK
jgi:transcription initiation factor TFIID subunit TAF12